MNREDSPRIARFRIPGSSTGRRDLAILEALRSVEGFGDVTRSQLKKWTESGAIREAEDGLFTLEIPALRPMDLAPVAGTMEILFEDEHLLVVNKPTGMSVHPSGTETDTTLVQVLLHLVKDLSGIGGVERPGIVHRLDKETSGALVVAKTDAAHLGLSRQFAVHSIERRYWALTYGALPKVKVSIESKLGRNPIDRKKMSFDVKDGRETRTEARELARFMDPRMRAPFASWVEAKLHTGRTHQVRVHLAHYGASLLGDAVYGTPGPNTEKWKKIPPEIRPFITDLPGQALHARVLGFLHPITEERIRLEAEPPESFRALLRALEPYSSSPDGKPK